MSVSTLFLRLVSILLLPVVADAAAISWTSKEALSQGGLGETLSSGLFVNSGTLLLAQNCGGSATTFDGIPFAAGASSEPPAGTSDVFFATATGTANQLHGNSATQLSSTATRHQDGSPGIVTLAGLGIGTEYRVQILLFNGRMEAIGSYATIDGSYGGNNTEGKFGNGVANVSWGTGRLFTGIFVADASTQQFSIQTFQANGTPIGGQMNALSLHTYAPAPPVPLTPTQAAMASTATDGLPAMDAQQNLNRWFIDSLEYLGPVIDRPNYYSWCISGVRSDDGKYHLYPCQWSTSYGFGAWDRESEVHHFVADAPAGPYTYVDRILSARPGGDVAGVWNRYTAHNPEVVRIDGRYVLTYISYPATGGGNGRIGMKIADGPNGPWNDVSPDPSRPGLVLERSTNPAKPSYDSARGTDNPSLVKFDGKYWLFFMYNPPPSGDNTRLGVAVSDSLTGPYVEQDVPVFVPENDNKVEDLCAFNFRNSVYAIMADNYGRYTKNAGGGLVCRMDQETYEATGKITMILDSIGFLTRPVMFPNQDFSHGVSVYGANKFERPKIMMLDGMPSYLFLPSGFNEQGNPWTCIHGFRINLPDYEQWRSQSFNPAGAANDAISGPDSDPTHEGVSNLLRYALRIPPQTPVHGSGSKMPRLGKNAEGERVFSFPYNASIADLRWRAQSSGNLVDWVTVFDSALQPSPPLRGGRAEVAAPAAGVGSQFMRLRVTRETP